MITILRTVVMALALACMAAPLWAQPYPNRPVRLILPFPPSGATDILGRIVAHSLSERLGQPVVADNRPGLGGYYGLEMASKAAADGHTIVIASLVYASGPSLYRKMQFNPERDLTAISQISEAPNLVIVNPGVPAKTLKELVEHTRTNPGKLNYASSGVGSTLHLSAEMLRKATGMNVVHVPYKGGGGPAMTAVIGGEVQMIVLGPAALPHLQTGRARALAVMSEQRWRVLPDLPTAREAGFDAVVTSWHGLLAPTGTPRAHVARLSQEWTKLSGQADVRERLEKAGFDPRPSTPDQFAAFLKAEMARWSAIIKEVGIPPAD